MAWTRRERMMATMRGETVDRPPCNFYEIEGLDEDITDSDPFNIYQDPSWRSTLDLARERTDRIVMRNARLADAPQLPWDAAARTEHSANEASRWTVTTVEVGGRTLTARTRRDRDVQTTWTTEHLLKDVDDANAWLSLPAPQLGGEAETRRVLDAETALGDTGIVMLDTADPLCMVAPLFDMGAYTVIAMTEPALFHRMLERVAPIVHHRTEKVAQALPGRLWRIYGPEYASPPYLPPRLFREYVVRYVQPMVDSIQRYGGYARIHSHGRLHEILDDIVGMGVDGLDPIEPPPQGDVALRYVRERYGANMVLFGNLEASDIENLDAPAFAEKVKRAINEGTAGEGRGFVLQPSACPYGRVLSDKARRNYETIVEIIELLTS